jgi:deoxyribose-phosphate aldolase
MNAPNRAQVAKMIDLALLRPELTEVEVIAGCELALHFDVASVCVKPCHVQLAARILAGSSVAVGTVIGFPHGGSTTEAKIFESKDAVSKGAVELDMVINIGALCSGNVEMVQKEIREIVEACPSALIKVILENAFLTPDQIVAGCRAAESAGAHFVKTSTGFASSGATVDDVRLMRATVAPGVEVKASGGIKTLEDLLALREAGATRIGTSSTAKILDAYQ